MNDITELRTILFEALRKAKNGNLDTDQAKTISDLAGRITDTAKVEVAYLQVTQQTTGTGFISLQSDQPKLPEGMTVDASVPGVRKIIHRLKG